MKTTISSSRRFGLLFVFMTALSPVIITSCQKDEFERGIPGMGSADIPQVWLQNAEPVIYFGPETFTITSKEPFTAARKLFNPEFPYLEDFVLQVQNGNSPQTRVNKIEVWIDGVLVINQKDFNGRSILASVALKSLTANSGMRVRIDGKYGRSIKISVLGKLKPNIITDVEGNRYNTVQICGRWWMAENLRTTKFNDGTPIDNVTGNTDWIDHALNMVSGYCWYNNDPVNKDVYGALYNWTAVMAHYVGKQICPAGWHVPDSHYDLYEMLLCLDPDSHETMGPMSEIAGGMLKETGTGHWLSPNAGATNSTGFTALPGGERYHDGSFTGLGQFGAWWTDDGYARFFLNYSNTDVSFSEGGNEYGYSLRCIKDQP